LLLHFKYNLSFKKENANYAISWIFRETLRAHNDPFKRLQPLSAGY